jgi:hypothetical protein
MSFVSSNDHPNPNNPQDPLYYAPRSVRSQAAPRIPLMRPEELPVPTLSRFDEIGEDAFVRSMRPLESLNSSMDPVHHARCLPLRAELPRQLVSP